MNDVLNQDMMKAIESADLDHELKELVVNILFKERTKKNIVWDDSDAAEYYNMLLTNTQVERAGNGGI